MFKKLLNLFLVIVIVFSIPNIALAKGDEYFNISSIGDDNYFVKLDIIYKDGRITEPAAIVGKELLSYSIYGKSGLIGINEEYPYYCEYQWEEPEYIIQEGEQTVLVNAESFKGKTFQIKLKINGVTEDEYNERLSEELGVTLSKSKLSLKTKSMYDINIKSKINGSAYLWTSSNKKIAQVNKYGVVTGIKKGKAVITCTITTPDGKEVNLKCNVTVK